MRQDRAALAQPAVTDFNALLGLETEVVRPGETTVELDIEPHHLNRAGTLHGGVMMAMLDTLMGYAAYSALNLPGEKLVTTRMTTHFLEGITNGSLSGAGWVVARNEQYLTLEAVLRDQTGRQIASATGQYSIVRPGN